MMSGLRERFLEAGRAAGPLVVAICLLQVLLVRAPAADFLQFLAGACLAMAGMVFLFVGVDQGILPMGRFIGAELPKRRSVLAIVTVTAALGFLATAAEPDVIVLAWQAEAESGGIVPAPAVLYATAAGVGAFAAVGMARIIFGWPMKFILMGAYGIVLALLLLAPQRLVPLAFDAGSVTTGIVTAPMVIALTVGVSSVLAGRSTLSNAFGLIGFASVGPIILILLLSPFLS